jgi:hypothetical protein
MLLCSWDIFFASSLYAWSSVVFLEFTVFIHSSFTSWKRSGSANHPHCISTIHQGSIHSHLKLLLLLILEFSSLLRRISLVNPSYRIGQTFGVSNKVLEGFQYQAHPHPHPHPHPYPYPPLPTSNPLLLTSTHQHPSRCAETSPSVWSI